MSATGTETEHGGDLRQAVRDHLRLEIVAVGHIVPAGEVHVSDHAVAAHSGGPSNFNRATCLSLDQPGIAFGEVDRFFDGRTHTLWLDADAVDDDVDEVIRSHGYREMPGATGMASTELGLTEIRDPDNHVTLLSDPADAPKIAAVTSTGFGLGPHDHLVAEDLARSVLRHAKPWDHGALYGVRHDGELAAVAALLCTRDVAGIAGVFTLPAHRRHHHASALLRRMLRDAAAHGYRTAVTIATPDSRAALAGHGFRVAARFRVYRPFGRPGRIA